MSRGLGWRRNPPDSKSLPAGGRISEIGSSSLLRRRKEQTRISVGDCLANDGSESFARGPPSGRIEISFLGGDDADLRLLENLRVQKASPARVGAIAHDIHFRRRDAVSGKPFSKGDRRCVG